MLRDHKICLVKFHTFEHQRQISSINRLLRILISLLKGLCYDKLSALLQSPEQRLERGLRFICCIIKFSPEQELKNSPLKTWTAWVRGQGEGSVLIQLGLNLQGKKCDCKNAVKLSFFEALSFVRMRTV